MLVFDSSTVILLAMIELLDIFLNDFSGEVVLSKGVFQECTVKSTFDSLWIKRRVHFANSCIEYRNIVIG